MKGMEHEPLKRSGIVNNETLKIYKNPDNNNSEIARNADGVIEKPKKRKSSRFSLLRVIQIVSVNVLIQALQYFFILLLTFFVGQENVELIDTVSIYLVWLNLTFFPGEAFLEGLCVVCSENFGEKKYIKMGLNVNRVRFLAFINSLIHIILSFLIPRNVFPLIFSQSKDVIDNAIFIIEWTSFVSIFDFQYLTIKCYFDSQIYLLPIFVEGIISLGVALLSLFLFIQKWKLASEGVVLFFYVMKITRFLINLYFLIFHNPNEESNIFWDKRTFRFKPIWKMFKLCFFYMVCYFCETFCWQVGLFLIGKSDEYVFALGSICYNFVSLFIHFNLGWHSSVVVLIGNYLGKRNPKLIKKSMLYVALITTVCMMALFVFFLIFEIELFKLFTNDLILIYHDDTGFFMTLSIIYILINAFDYYWIGVIRGFGKLSFNMIISVSIHVVLIPLTMIICYFHSIIHKKGIFILAMSSSFFASLLWMGYYFVFINVDELCKDGKFYLWSDDELEKDNKIQKINATPKNMKKKQKKLNKAKNHPERIDVINYSVQDGKNK